MTSLHPDAPDANQTDSEDFRPSDFMRARRPSLFSDSTATSRIQLSREAFEYHLESLTSRKQEIEFEHFCRRLLEAEICPNLLPQTGPTGGGDSKVDAETYPVADVVALRWYEGVGQEASQQRWAFAFSTKKQWRQKVRSDVQEIVNTGRDYKLIYFVTSRFVKDKDRGQEQDTLTGQYGIPVLILDRTWIVKCIFEHNRLRIAYDTLHISGTRESTAPIVGPHDTEREIELAELERQIDDPKRYVGVHYQLIEDCLQAAILARGLERPRVEVDGRFARAERMAHQLASRQQMLRVVYAKAWTAFWWYNDFEELNRLYGEVEQLATGTSQATEVELVGNLWTVLHSGVQTGKLDAQAADLTGRTARLKAELARLASEQNRPANRQMARAELLLMQLNEAIIARTPLTDIYAALQDVLKATEGLAEYPWETITTIIRELGDVLPDSHEYDELLEIVIEQTQSRASEGEAGLVLLQRGYQKLRSGHNYDAIRLLGRAERKLAMQEYRPDWIAAIVGCSSAYEAAGLVWASRANMLVAANQALSDWWKHGIAGAHALRIIQRLVWLELQLGRVFGVLAWMELAALLAGQIIASSEQKESFLKERQQQDIVLSILLAKARAADLRQIEFLPEVLDQLGLHQCWIVLLYALGHEAYLRAESVLPESDNSEKVRELLLRLIEQPANDDLPDRPNLMMGGQVQLRSYVLGCVLTIEAENNPSSVFIAETILSGLEAFLATSLDSSLMPYRSDLSIIVQPAPLLSGVPVYQSSEVDGGETINVRHAQTFPPDTAEAQADFHKWLSEFLVHIAFEIAVVSDADGYIKQIIEDELSLGRAVSFSDVAVTVGNILGQHPKFALQDWQANTTQSFPLQSDTKWHYDPVPPQAADDSDSEPWQAGEGKPPEDLFGIDKLKHQDRRVISLINIPLWNQAKWRATAYIWPPDSEPVLGLCFLDAGAGKRIFEDWRRRLGEVDEQEQLYIAIITGIDKDSPHSYSVVVSTNPRRARALGVQHFVLVSRINRMDAPNPRNLTFFLDRYKQKGRYVIVPAGIAEGDQARPEPFFELWIGKKQLRVCPAWQIGEHDPAVVAIQSDSNPIIPEGVQDAPVIGALRRFEQRAQRRRTTSSG